MEEVEEVEEEYEEWEGFSDDNENKPKSILKRRENYGDDETEVTIEDLSKQNDLEKIASLNYVNLKESEKILRQSINRATEYAKIVNGNSKPKKPKRKFRYLTKNERRDNNRKAVSNKRRK